MNRRDDDDIAGTVGTLVAVLLAVGAVCVLIIVLVGCAIALGDNSKADVRINAPIDVDAKREPNARPPRGG